MTVNANERSLSGKPLRRPPWNKGKSVAPRPSLRPGHVWSIRSKLPLEGRTGDLALFNLAIDSKLYGCDVVAMRVDDVVPHGYTMDRATVRQHRISIRSGSGRSRCGEPKRR